MQTPWCQQSSWEERVEIKVNMKDSTDIIHWYVILAKGSKGGSFTHKSASVYLTAKSKWLYISVVHGESNQLEKDVSQVWCLTVGGTEVGPGGASNLFHPWIILELLDEYLCKQSNPCCSIQGGWHQRHNLMPHQNRIQKTPRLCVKRWAGDSHIFHRGIHKAGIANGFTRSI